MTENLVQFFRDLEDLLKKLTWENRKKPVFGFLSTNGDKFGKLTDLSQLPEKS